MVSSSLSFRLTACALQVYLGVRLDRGMETEWEDWDSWRRAAKQYRMDDMMRIEKNLGEICQGCQWACGEQACVWETWGGDSSVSPGSLEFAHPLSPARAFLWPSWYTNTGASGHKTCGCKPHPYRILHLSVIVFTSRIHKSKKKTTQI